MDLTITVSPFRGDPDIEATIKSIRERFVLSYNEEVKEWCHKSTRYSIIFNGNQTPDYIEIPDIIYRIDHSVTASIQNIIVKDEILDMVVSHVRSKLEKLKEN